MTDNRQKAAALILSVCAALSVGTGAYADTTGFVVSGGVSGTCSSGSIEGVTYNKARAADKTSTAMGGYITSKQTPPPPPGRFVPVTQNVQGNQLPQQYSPAAIQNDLQLVKQGRMTPAAFQQILQQEVARAKNGSYARK
jgi:hypothetical protein